ncbi:MAG: glycerate kinase [Eubacteriales bacterium]|nr:glycerate kinase [Eubacteriales bacterium]
MIKIIIAPDSYKGTLSASDVANIMYSAIRNNLSDAEIIIVPIADGGEGTIEALHAVKIYETVSNPYFEPIKSFYGDIKGSAVIESAACCGLPLVAGRENPLLTTTFGVGEMIKKALDDGYRNIIIALGGSSTNDAGCGMAAALGVCFYGKNGLFIPTGGTLCEIQHIDISGLDRRLREASVTGMCDITNPLYGMNGAAHMFAPQKGANREETEYLDDGLRHISSVIKESLDIDVSSIEGAGTAGGMGAAAVAFLGGKLTKGIDVVLDAVGFDDMLCGTSLVITGEGRFDLQSIGGKVISGIAERTKKAGIPLISVAGSVEEFTGYNELGITAVFSIQQIPIPFSESVLRTKKDLYSTVCNVIRTFYAARL